MFQAGASVPASEWSQMPEVCVCAYVPNCVPVCVCVSFGMAVLGMAGSCVTLCVHKPRMIVHCAS